MRKFLVCLMVVMIGLGFSGGQRVYGFEEDVPPNHWAYNSISRAVNLGLMRGITVNRFGINELLCMFETSQILAALGGFRTQGATYDEINFIEYAYEKHLPAISEVSQHLATWRHGNNREIAFLMELGVFSPHELANFIFVQDGAEQRAALLRYQICVLFARLLEAEEVARAFVPLPGDLFADDVDIPVHIRPYVYYMRHLGIVSGDVNGHFYPAAGVVRSAMAVMLDLMVDLMGFNQGAPPASGPDSPPGADFSAFTGDIYQVFPDFRAIEVHNIFTGQRQIFPVTDLASITLNRMPSFFEALAEGMSVAGVLVDGSVTQMVALTPTAAPPSAPDQIPPPQQGLVPDISVMANAVIEGIIKDTRSVGDLSYIDVSLRLINSVGDIVEETLTFHLDYTSTITRGGSPVDFWSINMGDVATLTVTGNRAFSISLEERFRNITGSVVAKRPVANTGMGVLSVQDHGGRVHELVTTDSSSITRMGHVGGIPSWRDIRVGDSVEISAEFNQILSLGAAGTRSFVDVIVTRITISTEYAELSGVANGISNVYPIIPGMGVNLYGVRVGSTVRLALDSMEVEDILILEDPRTNDITGFIRSVIDGNRIILQNDADSLDFRSFTFDASTVITDANTGAQLTTAALTRDIRVYLTYDRYRDNHITSLTVLGF